MKNNEPEYTVYISFSRNSREDVDFAGRIASALSDCYPSPMQIDQMKWHGTERTDADREALSNADFLIVICSIDSANDIEVNHEVERFLFYENGNSMKIISLIINGTPCAQKTDEEECLPPRLRGLYASGRNLFFNLSVFRQRYDEERKHAMCARSELEMELSAIKEELANAAVDIRRMRNEKHEKEEYIRHLQQAGNIKEREELEELQRKIEDQERRLKYESERIAHEKEVLRKEREELDNERLYKSNQEPGVTYNPHCNGYSRFDLLSRFSKKGGKTVYSSVFAPSEVKRDSHMLVQVYLHLAGETELVKSLAEESQPTAQRRDYSPLQCKLFKGDRIKVTLTICNENLIKEESKELVWMGSFTKCSFDYVVPHRVPTDEICCSVLLSIGDYPIGEMKFITKIVPIPRKLNSNVLVKQFKKVFISYAHKDSDNVQFVAKAYKALGIKYFFDSDNLEGGDVYEEKILNNIDSSDLFILCWSENAAKSKFIPKEIDRALLLSAKTQKRINNRPRCR